MVLDALKHASTVVSVIIVMKSSSFSGFILINNNYYYLCVAVLGGAFKQFDSPTRSVAVP